MNELPFQPRPETDLPLPIQLPPCSWTKNDLVTRLPARVPLDVQIESHRSFDGYEEWKLSFASESTEGLPDPTLARVPAYLLVPTDTLFTAPFPAAVAFHQCGRDCDIGKDSVVGRAVERPDQAYGLELVRLGFVVLAPESINCGERIIRSIRTAGAPTSRWTHDHCWSHLGRFVPWGSERWKKLWDGVRAVDFLRALPFVNSENLAVVGHSMGSGTALDTLIADPRIRAAILSPGGCSDEARALAAPRLLIQQQADLDATAPELASVAAAQAGIRQAYETTGAPPGLAVHQRVNHGHHFSDEFKVTAYRRLKAHFGLIANGEPLLLLDLLRQTLAGLEKREDLWWSWHTRAEGSKLPPITLTGDSTLSVRADSSHLIRAFETTIIPLTQKIPHGSELRIDIRPTSRGPAVVLTIPDGDDHARSAHESLLRLAPHHFAHCGGTFQREPGAALCYQILFGPAAPHTICPPGLQRL